MGNSPVVKRIVDFARVPWIRLLREGFSGRAATFETLSLPFMDLRSPQLRDPEGLGVVLRAALSELSDAGQGFGELVTSHLRLVIAADDPMQGYAIPQSAWASSFRDGAQTNPHILACQLVWAATAIRLTRDSRVAAVELDRGHVRDACWTAQRRFLTSFDDAEYWIDYLDPDNTDSGAGTA